MTTYNLARMNMFLHNINYDKFSIERGDTLLDPKHGNEKPFDAIVSNPPYSIKWVGSDDPTLINDDRFAPAGVLAPKSKADFAFIMHSLSYLSSKGRAAIVTFPGIFYRGGAEKENSSISDGRKLCRGCNSASRQFVLWYLNRNLYPYSC